jgi:osmotically-inducible protein OsmY
VAALAAFASKEKQQMKTDMELKADVTAELAWDPAINAANIGVMVKDGVVTLAGHLNKYSEKHAVERAVRRVAGVRAIALDLDVKLSPEHKRDDSDIAQAAIAALRLNSLVPDGKVKVEVENGWITLTGQVDWAYQFASAEQCLRPLAGVRGIDNHVAIKPRVQGKDIAAQIKAALTRQAEREARHIGIEVDGAVVTLSGSVHSMAEHDAAVGVAYSAHGVSRVVDHLQVTA